MYRVAQNIGTIFLYALIYHLLTNFQTHFIVRIRRTFV